MEESTGIIVDYNDWTDKPPAANGTFSYGYTTVIYIPAPDHILAPHSRLKTTHTLPNGDVISIG
jgi:hypothetical protein